MTRVTKKAPRGPDDATRWEDLRGTTPLIPPRRRGVPETEHSAAKAKLRSEQRRLRRMRQRAAQLRCFHCRQMGHVLEDCPQAEGAGHCYRCGSTEHTSKMCSKQGFQFARCFVCQQMGHLSGACPQNAHGAYPDGGQCKKCGSKTHLAKDCKMTDPAHKGEITLSTDANAISADTDDTIDALTQADEEKKQRRVKKSERAASAHPAPVVLGDSAVPVKKPKKVITF